VHVLIQRQQAVALQQEQACGGDLLARRRDVEDRAGADRDVVLDHRAAGGGVCHQRAVPVDTGRVARAAVGHVRRDQVSELCRVHRRHSSGMPSPAPGWAQVHPAPGRAGD